MTLLHPKRVNTGPGLKQGDALSRGAVGGRAGAVQHTNSTAAAVQRVGAYK